MCPEDATILMNAAAARDKAAADRLLPLVYDQLRRAAETHLAHDPRGKSGTIHALFTPPASALV